MVLDGMRVQAFFLKPVEVMPGVNRNFARMFNRVVKSDVAGKLLPFSHACCLKHCHEKRLISCA
jgi:hypothetical protein